tara:strand:- start:37 stop:405 length:369 start_codon:yes stop_codon:yes gene_type:complete
MDRPSLQHLSLRMAGVVVTLAVLFVIDLTVDDVVNQLWLPLLLAAGAYLMTLSLMAVAIAVGSLALLHADLAAAFWVPANAYPMLVAVSALIIGWILIQRFRQRIKDTHEERWANRSKESDE